MRSGSRRLAAPAALPCVRRRDGRLVTQATQGHGPQAVIRGSSASVNRQMSDESFVWNAAPV